MRLLYIADARSPIAINWINYFIGRGDEVHVLSSAPSSPDDVPGAASFQAVPIALSGLKPGAKARPDRGVPVGAKPVRFATLRHGPLAQLTTDVRYLLSSIEIHRHVGRTAKLIENIGPDLVHAMRIPFEGILAALACKGVPLVLSVWGNDLTLYATRYPPIGALTRKALKRTNALHSDCRRDLRLAPKWGFDPAKPAIVLPGAGGIQSSIFHFGPPDASILAKLDIPPAAEVVINPRGFRSYVRSDTFFRSIPLVLKQRPAVVFLCSAMAGNSVAEGWIERLGVRAAVRLLPSVSREEMAEYFRLAQITVSMSEHDGTPNTLLEAMACGCFPVAGNIETVNEWISDGVNGLLCDSGDAQSVAAAILRGLEDRSLRERAREENFRLISERADYGRCMAAAAEFYTRVARAG